MAGTLILVRHGESEWNLKNLFTGWKNPELTERGIAEARAAGKKIRAAGLTPTVFFTSALRRAQHSLDLMLDELGIVNLVITRDQALNERDYGDLAGLNKDDARKKWGEEQVLIWRRSYDVPPPGGESLKDTAARTLPYYDRHILPAVEAGHDRTGRRPRQFAALDRHGDRGADPRADFEARTRDGGTGGLSDFKERQAQGAGGYLSGV